MNFPSCSKPWLLPWRFWYRKRKIVHFHPPCVSPASANAVPRSQGHAAGKPGRFRALLVLLHLWLTNDCPGHDDCCVGCRAQGRSLACTRARPTRTASLLAPKHLKAPVPLAAINEQHHSIAATTQRETDALCAAIAGGAPLHQALSHHSNTTTTTSGHLSWWHSVSRQAAVGLLTLGTTLGMLLGTPSGVLAATPPPTALHVAAAAEAAPAVPISPTAGGSVGTMKVLGHACSNSNLCLPSTPNSNKGSTAMYPATSRTKSHM